MAFRSLLIGGLIGGLLSPAAFAADGLADSIEIFTASTLPIETGDHTDVTIYALDGLESLEKILGQDLPADPDRAKSIALGRLTDIQDDLQILVENTVEGLSKAQAYGLRKLPAIVFDDGRQVVYGVTDLDRAIDIYQEASGS